MMAPTKSTGEVATSQYCHVPQCKNTLPTWRKWRAPREREPRAYTQTARTSVAARMATVATSEAQCHHFHKPS